MSKHKTLQRYIYKIGSSRLRKSKWSLTLTLPEARSNDELIPIDDRQIIRWIDELNNVEDSDSRARTIRTNIKAIKKEPNSLQNRRKVRKLYEELDRIQFIPDYMCLVIERNSDYWRACKGFTINGIKYARLVGTSGGVKNSTIVFVSERLVDVLRERIDNGRSHEVKLVPAKLEAYRALTCSGSTPVSMPNGILVVNDCITTFFEDVIEMSFFDGDEPEMKFTKNKRLELDESDGYGLILPSLAKRWSSELDLNYDCGGFNTRMAWEKGMVFAFDFLDFAENVAGQHIVKDAWGNDVDITKVEMILTTSMLKLWNCYDSLEHYLACCEQNHYQFSITKTAPDHLESERTTNYQFLQSYTLSDDQIEELIEPTMTEIRDVLSGDYRKAILFCGGTHLDKDNVDRTTGIVKAMIIDKRIYDDPYTKSMLMKMIRKRINNAKIGVIKTHANYSIICGDPYALCQSIFGMEVTGLLRKGEIYNNYWDTEGPSEVVCFRAPMSNHNNIIKMKIARRDDVRYWYRFIPTCTMFNDWDSSAAALNGMDKDGDLVFITDNAVLVNNFRETPSIICAQRNAEKVDPKEEDLIQANINGFGDDIGKITNRITAMFDVMAGFSPDSKEYQVLDYRIKSGQLLQQDAIDKVKGIIVHPMPKTWYCRAANHYHEDTPEPEKEKARFNMRIIADKKPYFMRYIYQDLMREYNNYIKNTNRKAVREFRKTVDDLLAQEESDDALTDRERNFIRYYKRCMPLNTNDSVMNRICRRFENEFDHYFTKNQPDSDFDYTFMRSGCDYTSKQLKAILNICEQHLVAVRSAIIKEKHNRFDDVKIDHRHVVGNSSSQGGVLSDIKFGKNEIYFQALVNSCLDVCSNEKQLCDIVLDACYKKSGMKQLCWDICGETIIDNLFEKNDYTYTYPVQCDDGDICFGGKRFKMEVKEALCG